MGLHKIQVHSQLLTLAKARGLELYSPLNVKCKKKGLKLTEGIYFLTGTQKATRNRTELFEGSGNLIWRAEKLKKLGVKASEQVDNQLIGRLEL